MLSYKEYKLLNESLYGAFNLGLRSPHSVGGIVSGSSINGTEAALEAESEEAIAEAKKAKKMKKKMDSEDMEPSDEEEKKVVDSEEDHDEDEDHDDDEDSDEDEDHDDDEDSDEDEDHDDEESDEDDKPMFMKKKMKKKSKKEWSEVMSDLEEVLEGVNDEDALQEIKKGLETIKEGFKKGHMKNHKKGCDCKLCKNKEDKEDGDDDEGLTDAQKKLPDSLRKAILAKKGKKKDDGDDDKKCGKMMDKKCGKYMNEDDQAWWNSVNSMLGSDPDQRNWDGGWSEVGEVQQAVRVNESIVDAMDRVAGQINSIGTRPGAIESHFSQVDSVMSHLAQKLWNSKIDFQVNKKNLDEIKRMVSRPGLTAATLLQDLGSVFSDMAQNGYNAAGNAGG